MALTDEQQAKLQAFIDSLNVTAAAVTHPDWWRPSANDEAEMISLYGLTAQQLFGDDQTKITPLPGYDEHLFKLRTAYGYASSGVRLAWQVKDLQAYRDFADRLFKAPDANALNDLYQNAAAPGVETDAPIAAVMLGQCTLESFMPRVYKVPGPPNCGYFPARTLSDVSAYMLQLNPIVPPGV